MNVLMHNKTVELPEWDAQCERLSEAFHRTKILLLDCGHFNKKQTENRNNKKHINDLFSTCEVIIAFSMIERSVFVVVFFFGFGNRTMVTLWQQILFEEDGRDGEDGDSVYDDLSRGNRERSDSFSVLFFLFCSLFVNGVVLFRSMFAH